MKSTIINIVVEIMRLIANSLTMSPIEDEIYYCKWWNMALVVEKGLEIRSNGRVSLAVKQMESGRMTERGDVFSLPEASLYRGPFTKVVMFDLAMSVPTIEPELYGMNFIPAV